MIEDCFFMGTVLAQVSMPQVVRGKRSLRFGFFMGTVLAEVNMPQVVIGKRSFKI